MKMRFAVAAGLALALSGYFSARAVAQDPPAAASIPEAGIAGSYSGPKIDLECLAGAGISGRSAGRALSRLSDTDGLTTRGALEAKIYQQASPSVVLVLTKDGMGSGSVISKDGQIITNYHVIAGYSEVGVIFKPAREGDAPSESKVVAADVIKIDEVADLALLKLKGRPRAGLVPIALGNVRNIKIGDDVNAIGHPTGETWTFTKGYVSQVRRGFSWNEIHAADVIQTQTPINPGNSGGPLLDSTGAMIGINAFKGEGEGMNFAIAATEVEQFLQRKGDRRAPKAKPRAAVCSPKILFEGRNKENTASIRRIDTECNGTVGMAIVLPDDKSKPMYVLVDSDSDGNPDGMVLSNKRDGYWDISYWDQDGDKEWDTVGYHPDGDVVPTEYGPYIKKKG